MFASSVTYSTIGTFSSSGTNVYTGANGLSITYTDLINAMVAPPYPTNAQFGSFSVSGPAAGDQDSVSTDFTLILDQTNPTNGTETLTDTFSGQITANSSNIRLTFTGGSGDAGTPTLVLGGDPITGASAYTFSLGGVTYWIDAITPINPSSTGGGFSTINGAITSAVPEPALFGLSGLSFAGLLGFLAWRRKRIA
jgi:hypothetical protein